MKMRFPPPWTVVAVAWAGIATILAAEVPAVAQEGPVIIGGSGLPSVEVHLEVLDELERLAPAETAKGGPVIEATPPARAGAEAGEVVRANHLPLPPFFKPGAPLPEMKPALAAANELLGAEPAEPKAPEQPSAAPQVSAAPIPAPGEAPSVKEKQSQTAALLPPSSASATGGMLRITFGPEEAELPPGARAQLQSLAAQLEADERARLQLRAYASGTTETASQARRLSLSRALAVRSYLIEQGVRSTRVDVRALGIPEDQGPADRVDVVLLKP